MQPKQRKRPGKSDSHLIYSCKSESHVDMGGDERGGKRVKFSLPHMLTPAFDLRATELTRVVADFKQILPTWSTAKYTQASAWNCCSTSSAQTNLSVNYFNSIFHIKICLDLCPMATLALWILASWIIIAIAHSDTIRLLNASTHLSCVFSMKFSRLLNAAYTIIQWSK